MGYYLAKFDGNWADEMDIRGFCIINKDDKDVLVDRIKAYTEEFEICIGTNEDLYYDNGEEFLNDMSFKEISDSESETLSKLFGKSYAFDIFNRVLETIDGE